MQTNQDAIKIVDELLLSARSEADALLDLRLSLAHGDEPGVCITHYFSLVKKLTGWQQNKLQELRDSLESRIQLQIVIQETKERRNECLALGNNDTLETYCEEQMRRVGEAHKDAKNIHLSFSWA